MHTLGYRFKPWTEERTIADGALDPRVRAPHRARARHRPQDPLPPPRRRAPSGPRRTRAGASRPSAPTPARRCGSPATSSGPAAATTATTRATPPSSPGVERFAGPVVHPQHWPEDLDYAGKKVVVIGSGATAVTLVPAMAEKAAHVTMLQRSPTYIASLPGRDPIAGALRRYLPQPRRLRDRPLEERPPADAHLPAQPPPPRAGEEDDPPRGRSARCRRATTSTPTSPRATTPGTSACAWCPTATSSGRSPRAARRSSPTGSRPSPRRGIRLESGKELEADVIVTATGLNLLFLGGIELSVDGEPVDVPTRMAYKGMMLSDVPNAAFTVGYTNASWTLKADLTSEYVCRLLAHMDAHGYASCVPEARPRGRRAAAARLHLRLRPALARPLPQTGLARALEAAPELRPRHPHDPPRRDRRRHDALLPPGAEPLSRGSRGGRLGGSCRARGRPRRRRPNRSGDPAGARRRRRAGWRCP